MFLSNSGMMLGGSNNNNNNSNNNNNNGASGAGLGVGMNNGQMQGNNGVQPMEGTSIAPAATEYSLAGILHYLQSEWRKYERDRNEWEIERAEMRARIALLEGERRGVENLKTDLMRRVKMLEYALRQERSKYLSSTTNNSVLSSVPPQAKNPLLQGLEKAASSSGRSSPGPMFEVGQTGPGSAIPFNPNTVGAGPSAVNSTLLGNLNASAVGGQLSRSISSAKDPKSRAKSREYLKQCLQEISYLTSATTLNPLPDRGVASGSHSAPNAVQIQQRPRMVMSENVPPPTRQTDSQPPMAGTVSRGNASSSLSIPDSGLGKTGRPGRSPLFASEALSEEEEEEQPSTWQARGDHAQQTNPLSATFVDPNEAVSNGAPSERDDDSASSQSASSGSLQSPASSSSFTDNELDGGDQVTAIFKPETQDWQKLKEEGLASRERREAERQGKSEESMILSEAQQQLAITSDKVNQLMNRSARHETKDGEDDLANLSLLGEDDDAAKDAASAAADNLLWKSKRVLRSHLDAVRIVAFSQSELCLLSASDDNTIKFWNLDFATMNQNPTKTATESSPLVTFRGHSAAVTSLALSTSKQRFYSASLDSSIRVWQLPDSATEPYPPFDKTTELGCLVGHSQAVWDLALLPDRSDEEGLLASASADGTVKVWTVRNTTAAKGHENVPAELQLSWDYFGSEPAAEASTERENLLKQGAMPVPVSIDSCHSDLRLIAVGFSNSVVKLFDLNNGRQVLQLKSDETFDGTPGTQINKIVTHPTLPMLISAHEDGYIRMFDLDTGACTLSMIAHLDAVTSLDIDASGLTMVSGGHDCSVRFWDIAGGSLSVKDSLSSDTAQGAATTAVCRQEISSHRKKAGEGVLCVKYHPTAPFFASTGADGVIRIYG